MNKHEIGTSTDQGVIASYNRGWYTMEDGTKVRSKDITITPKGTTKSVIDRSKYKYTTHDAKTSKGSKRLDNNDDIAAQLRECEWHNADDNGFAIGAQALTDFGVPTTAQELWDKYAKLNPGMRRMNVGNRIRGAQRRFAKAQAKEEASE